MILGIVLMATRGLPRRMAWVFGGAAAGCAGAGLVAFFAESISQALSGAGQEMFNAGILFTAALFIGWTVVWMRKNAHGMAMHLKHIGHEAKSGALPLYSLALIIGLALLREGSEIVLFVYSMILSGQNGMSIVSGSLLGLALGAVAGIMLYFGLLKIPARYTLKVTSWLLILLVAGLASQGAGFLAAAGYFSGWTHIVWDTSWLLSEGSIAGKALHSLIGYSERPSVIQLLFYVGTLSGLLAIMNCMDGTRAKLALHFPFSLPGRRPG